MCSIYAVQLACLLLAQIAALQHGNILRSARVVRSLETQEDSNISTPYAQECHTTSFDRYPVIMTMLQKLLASKPKRTLKLLSFGCSDGSECRTLRMYFPYAEIDGVDIDAKLISANAANNSDLNMQYFNNLSSIAGRQYDAVLMMSVLAKFTKRADEDQLTKQPRFSFLAFDETLKTLNKFIAVGGYAILYNSNYLFQDSSISSQYKILDTDSSGTSYEHESGFIPKYNRFGKLLALGGDDFPQVFFHKVRDAGQRQAEKLMLE